MLDVALAGLEGGERRAAVVAYLSVQAARAARVPGARADPARPLSALGLDSLAAIELANAVQEDLGVELSMADLLAGPTLDDVTDEILARLAAEEAPAALSEEEIEDEGDGAARPVSHGERALWLLDRLAPEDAAYVIAGAARVSGELDTEALRSALAALVARHDALRTSFQDEGGEPVARVLPAAEPAFAVTDASAWSEAELARALDAAAHRPFDLAAGPHLRAAVFRRAADEHLVVLAVHHIAADFWSMGVLLNELGALYAGAPPESLPPLGGSWAAAVRRERRLLAGPEGERLQEHWRAALAGRPQALDLPADRPRPRAQTFRGDARFGRLPARLAARLEELCREAGATLFMGAMAAFQALLGRLSGQEELLVGTPTTGPRDAALAGRVGYLVNPVVVAADLRGEPGFAALLARVRAAALAAFAHRDLPFPLLAERLALRDPSRSPVFQAMLVLHGERRASEAGLAAFALGDEGATLSLGGLSLESVRLAPRGAQLDLTLALAPLDGALGAALRFNRDLFDGSSAERMLGQLATLLAGAAEDPSRSVWELPLLTAEERRQMLVEWNGGAGEPAAGGLGDLLHEPFFRHAAEVPEKTALVLPEREVSYGDLARRARRMAAGLRRLGVGPEIPVAICLPRGADLVAAIYAVLAAGGAYVPLDPAYPAARLAFMTVDSGARAIVATPEIAARLGDIGIAIVASEDLAREQPDGESAQEPSGAAPESLAYVVYTSGSTGRPKGVAVPHAAAAALVRWGLGTFSAAELAGAVFSTSVCFDVSVFELFVPLAAGGSLVVAEDALALADHPAAGRATLLSAVPSAVAELLRGGWLPPSLHTVALGGEPVPRSLADDLHARTGVARVLDVYGPTECTVYAAWAELREGDWGAAPIGRPVAGAAAYVVDRRLAPQPAGVPGELLLGGAGVARGYLGRPDLTAERFLPDPFSGRPGARLYRTGDLAAWRFDRNGDGELAYLGRLDDQIKIKGFRVELGEVEAALRALPLVAEAAVAVRAAAAGDPRLAAYAVPAAPAGPPSDPAERAMLVEALRAGLARALPAHMVPAAFVVLDALPRLPNGKVDRKALPEPRWGAAASGGQAPPRTPLQEIVAGFWSEVLGVPGVGAEDDFFRLGGHSLLASQVVSRVRAALGVELPLRALFESPTVAGLAARIESARGVKGEDEAPPIARSAEPPVLSFAQERLWILDQLAPGSALYNMPSAVRLAGALDRPALAAALGEVARRHEVLRTSFPRGADGPRPAVAPAVPFALPEVDLAGLPEPARQDALGALAADEARRPFDLATGPLLRATLVRLSAEDHALLVNLHHIVADGWSIGILAREVSALYPAAAAGRPSPLPEPQLQYTDFARWQRGWLAGEALASRLARARARLAGAPTALDLPTDRPRAAATASRGGELRQALPGDFVAGLAELGRASGATLFMTLLAGWTALLARYAGTDDLLVGSPAANRDRLETEGLIGLFVNTVALRARPAGESAAAAHLARLRDEALDVFADQDLPFEALVEALAPERDLGRAPLVQALFALQNVPAWSLALPGLDLSLAELPTGEAKFDLEVEVAGQAAASGDLPVRFAFRRDLFDAVTIERMAACWRTLLAGMAARPDSPLADLPLLSAGEEAELRAWERGPGRDAAEEVGVLARFAAQARRWPAAPAVRWAEGEIDGKLSYAELSTKAGAVAAGLRALGVGKGSIVGLSTGRNGWLAAGLLGIWKAGAAFLPLDPSYPRERLLWMLADSGAAAVAGEPAALAALAPPAALPVLPLDDLAPATGAHGRAGLSAGFKKPRPDDLAYVIYTSGSTGRPKGVAVEHGSLAHLLAASLGELGWSAGDVAPALAPYSFDIFLFELLSPLLAGGCCELVPLQPALDVEALVARLPRYSRLHAVPALMRQVVEGAARLPAPPSIETLFTGGDAVPRDLLLAMRRTFPQTELRVLYGPTEGTIVCTSRAVAPGEAPPESASIGLPLPGMEVSLRDAAGRRVPVGVPGEIWIGGPGVARGYLGQSELTQERFVASAEEGGRRFYCTGDLARRLPSGELAFLGRADGQVKLRGFRVELGEIESVLAEHPEVEAAVAAVAPIAALDPIASPAGDRRLVAYVVPRGEAAEGARWRALESELRDLLAARLPDYMVPAVLSPLATLPLLPTGKVDRRALPAPSWPAVATSEAPRTPIEEIVAGIWAELLGLPRIGRHDGFFALGGHSLLATQAVSRLRRALGIELPLRALFEAPTVAGLAAWIDRRLGGEAEERPPLLPRAAAPGFDAAAPLPLSFAQERLWFLHRLEPESPLYNIPVGVRLRGPLVPDDLAAALSAIARRHEALRTLFRDEAGEPAQAIAPPAPVLLPEYDLRRSPEALRTARAQALARAEAERPFDLAAEPPLRALLLRLADDEWWLVLSVHHIAADGWSMGVLVRELSEVYRARWAGEAAALPELPVQYADFALWQRAWLAGGTLARQLAWWRERLAGATAALDLPADRPRPALRARPAGLATAALAAEEARALRGAASAAGATPFMVLLAAWQAQLARLSGQDDLSIGTPIANRTLIEAEPLIGLFVNTLVLRGDLSGDPSFGELVGRAREAALGAYAHQDLPFEKLVEALAPERDLGQTPLFQVMLAVQNAPLPSLDLGGVSWTPLPVHSGRAKFDLTLSVTEEGEGLAAVLEHDAELFDPATAGRLLAQWRAALAAGAADPGLALSALPLLAPTEREQLLSAWGDGGPTPAAGGMIHELFAAAARRVPAAAALLCAGRAVTYGELAGRAAALARRLRARGVGPEVRVGVCLPRTPDLVAALLAVLAAGGAYVPMDPAYPAERLRFMAEDAGVAAVLTGAGAADRLTGVSAPLLRLEDVAHEPEPPEIAAPALDAENLAYVIYTSGSTGVPKGVAIAHKSAAAFVAWARGVFPDEDLAGVLASTSVCFDLSVFEIFVPLAYGGRVILAPDALHLPRLPEAGEVRLVNTVPSAIAELARSGGLPPSVRTVNLAGEPLVRSLADELYALGVGRVLDLYGPTEDTTYSTWAPVEPRGERPPAIGRPLPGSRARVLDGALGLVPTGVAGELYLSGDGLARGYLGRPALTAERFVPDPFASGERMYRTGDRARWRAEGELEGDLEYLGRLDQQVKVRGYRIELGEVEAALKAYPGVGEAAVLARADGPGGERRLVAYVAKAAAAPGEEAALAAPALRAALRERLPEPMVPSAFVLLPALPLQPNGKVDRKALARIAPANPEGTAAGTAPRTPWEELVAGIWCEVLAVERVGVETSFFDLGGHSLLATRVVSRLRRASGVELPLRALFETPTVAGLARRLAAEAAGAVAAPSPIRRLPAGAAAPLSFAQERMWFLHRLDPADASYHMPLGARLEGSLDLAVLVAAMSEIARRHEVLRTAFASDGGRPAPRVLPPRPQELPVVDLAALPELWRERIASELARVEARRPFDLAALAPVESPTPPMRTTLLRLGATDHQILFILHHIVADGWSVGLYVRELAALYRAFAAGRPSPLPELPIQYADFAAWQRERLEGDVFAAQLDFWRGELQGAPLVLELPADRPRPAVRGLAGGRSPLPLAPELTDRLARFGRREGVTLFMTLLAAFQALLGRLTGQETVLVGSPIAGRNRADVEGMIGFFANTLVLRGDLAGEPGLSALAARAREHTLSAHVHQDLPFEKLVEALEPQRNLAVTPLFQAMFALQNAPLGASELPGLRLEPFEIDSGTAKFDLTIAFSEEGGKVDGWLEHGRDLFDATTGRRIAGQYLALLAAAVERPEEPLVRLPLLAAAERHQLVAEWNDTAAPAPPGTLHGLFEAQAAARPGAVAVICRGERWTYAELNARANRIARLLERLGVRAGDNVGIWLRRGPDAVAALLGVLKAGAAYVPLDPDWPSARRLVVLQKLAVPVVLSESPRLRSIEEIEWRLPALRHVVCLDIEAPRVPPEPLDARAVAGMWDHVAERATDEIGAAGFVSSYTGQPFAGAEVDEYLARVVALARPYLGPDKRVLEIGCGSGLILFALAPQVGRYVGLDPSPRTQERNRQAVAARGLAHVELATGFAHEVDRLPAAEYDLVILASVAQFFPGRVYLERVVESLLARLAPGGAILLADLLDDRRKDELRRSLEEFHDLHRGDPEIRTKTQIDSELYLDEDLFADLAAEQPAIGGVRILHRTAGFANELGLRYDVVLEKAAVERAWSGPERRKSLWTAWHLSGLPAGDLPPVQGDPLAYTIFTSGSTGIPKGVAMRHLPAVNLVRWANAAHGVGPDDRVLFVASLCFDLSVYDVFGLLAAGGSIHVATEEELRDPQALVRLLVEEPITFWDSAPAGLQHLVPFFPPPNPIDHTADPRLRLVFLSGDWIPVTLPDRVRASFPRARVIALGGATEAAIWSNHYPVGAVAEGWRSIPYGRPLASCRYHVLDAARNPCPAGIPGDLAIGGLCLAIGYYGDAVQTAERFVPDPVGREPGARVYMTGDRARYLADGNLEFLGRRDHQVKIRGFRIEQGEIESALAAHPGVRANAVVVREDLPGDRRLVAYLVPRGTPEATAPDDAELRSFLRRKLPEYMVPSAFVPLPALPLTPNGKLDRQALPAPAGAASGGAAFAAPESALERQIAAIWQEALGRAAVGRDDNFFEIGGHSLLLAELHGRLQALAAAPLTMVDLFRYPTVRALAAHLAASGEVAAGAEAQGARAGARRAAARAGAMGALGAGRAGPVAIVGMAGRFPGAQDVESLWANLLGGVESIARFSAAELVAAGADPAQVASPDYVPARGVVSGADLFDAAFFGLTPREAEIMDPQQRLFLECAWEALEDAGYAPGASSNDGVAVGLFAGASLSGYLGNLYSRPDVMASAGDYPVVLANDKDFLATRVSYKLDLKGPSVAVQTACSTSLVAVHLACRSLLAGECDLALAGGVSIKVPLVAGDLYREGGILSPDGHCRPFDAAARGTVNGSGVGLVALKRLDDALASGDRIVAVIRGSAVNNDGSAKVGYTAPSVDGQAAVIAEALAAAGVEPATIGYVEAHGTGTRLGDPIEAAALAQALGPRAEPCVVGSLKSNLGHLDAAAGVAGLIKAALAVQHGAIPPSLHFERPSPEIDFAASGLAVAARRLGWDGGGAPRRAGVSSFGIGGTNAHVVLEEAPAVAPEPDPPDPRPRQLLVLSARSEEALDRATERLADHLARHPELDLADVAFTLAAGRRAFPHRRALVATGVEDARRALAERDPSRLLTHGLDPTASEPAVAFLFPGQGAQHAGMAADLCAAEPAFRAHLAQAAEIARPHVGVDLLALLHPADGEREAAATALARPEVAPVALFAVEMALARLWMDWGVVPRAMIGHSLGEYAAACIAGVFTLEEGIALVADRAALMASLPAGAMLAVPLPEAEVAEILARWGGELALAAVNAPGLAVVSGPPAAIAALREELAGRGVEARQLPVPLAFHSGVMDPILDRFAERVAQVALRPPQIPYVSNLTGRWIEASEATDPRYWARQLRATVRFGDGLATLAGEGERPPVLLEVGPGKSLASFAKRAAAHWTASGAAAIVSSLGHRDDVRPAGELLLAALGCLWIFGAAVDWRGVHAGGRRRRVALPTYPFERRRYWIERAHPGAAALSAAGPRAYVPVWRRAPLAPVSSSARPSRWLLFADGTGLGGALAERLRREGATVATVARGAGFAHSGERAFAVGPDAESYAALAHELVREGEGWSIVHLWGIEAAPREEARAAVERGFGSLLLLGEALRDAGLGGPFQLAAVACGLFEVTGHDRPRPAAATLLGALRALASELPGCDAARAIDVWPEDDPAALAELLARELAAPADPARPHVAYRTGRRWVEVYDELPAAAEPPSSGEARDLRIGGAAPLTETLATARPGDRLIYEIASGPSAAGAGLSAADATSALVAALAAGEGLLAAARQAGAGALVFLSSLQPLLGGRDLAVPCAVAAYAEALAEAARQEGGTAILAFHRQPGEAAALERAAIDAALALGEPRAAVALRDPRSFLPKELETEAEAAPCAAARHVAPGGTRPLLGTPYEPPRDALEGQIAGLWQELLGIAPIGVHDNFYELGGHSLLATQLVSRLRELAGVRVGLEDFFAHPTVAGLAAWIAGRQAESLGEDELAQLLAEVQEMGADEVEAWALETGAEPRE